MTRLARAHVGDQARILVGDLAEPLALDDANFDSVVASLVLHYLRDWTGPLREIRRVLGPGGAVVFSTHHPTMDGGTLSPDDYFAIKEVTEVWTKGSGTYEVSFWRRPLTAMAKAIHEAGFLIELLVEPMPVPELREKDPAPTTFS